MTNEYSVKLKIPEGYEPDDGEQPRQVFQDDICLKRYSEVETWTSPNSSFNHHIILKKKAPVYNIRYVCDGRLTIKHHADTVYVESQALEDALAIIEDGQAQMTPEQLVTYNALTELLK